MSQAPPGHPAPQGPEAALLARRSWRLLHSAWVLWPLASMGLLAWVGFLWVGLRARRWVWWACGLAYFTVHALLLVVLPDDALGDTTGEVLLGVWFASTVHAVVINRSWLRALAALSTRPPWFVRAPQGGTHPATADLAPWAAAALLPPPGGGPAGGGPPGGGPPGGPVDVNTASAAVLADLEEVSAAQAEHAVAVRSARGPFPGVEAFADVAGLQPHQLARLRGRP